MPAMENQGAPSNSDMTRLQLVRESAAILGVPISHVLQFAEGSSIEPHLSGFPAPPQSGLDPGWTLGELATLERTALAIDVPFSRLMRYAEATAHRFPKVETTPSSSDHITSIQNHPGVEWASAQGPWARSGSASFGAESIESVFSFSEQGAYPLQYPATQPVEEFAWKHVSYLVNGQTDPWNATGPSQSRYQSLQSSYNVGPPSSNSSTSHLVQYTPLQSSQGSPAGTPQQLGGSYTPSFETVSPQPFEYTIFGTGAGQSLEVPHIRHAVVQPDTDDFEALRHVPIYHDVPPTISGTTPLPASQEGPRVSVSPERNQHEETIAVAGTQSKHDDPNVNLVCLQCSKHQKKVSASSKGYQIISQTTTTDASNRQCKKIFPGGVCVRCDGVKNPQTGLKCINESLRSIVLFRTTTDPSSRKPYRQLAREDIYLSPALDAVRSRMGPWITIHLSQGPGAIALSVLPFDQIKAVSLVPPDSEHAKLYAHPYALGPDARKHVEEFLDANYLNYMSHYLVKGERNELDFAFFLAATCEVKRPSVELVSNASSASLFRPRTDTLRVCVSVRQVSKHSTRCPSSLGCL
jgi:hypothetical protein